MESSGPLCIDTAHHQDVVVCLDFTTIYFELPISILQRDMAERGHSLESIRASIEARKPDFNAYIGEACRQLTLHLHAKNSQVI